MELTRALPILLFAACAPTRVGAEQDLRPRASTDLSCPQDKLVLQPSGAGFGTASVLALGSAVAYAFYLTFTRVITRHEPVPVIIFWNSGLVMLLGDWMAPTFFEPGVA